MEETKTNEDITKEDEVKEEEKKDKKNKKEDKKLKDEIETLKKENTELKEKNMRISADMINTLRRKDEENSRMLKYSNESLILEILQVVDNFERALDSFKDESNEKKGIDMIYNNLINILEKFEVKEIEALDKEFDANYHQAVMQDEDKDKESNIITCVMQKGYTYKDKVIRPAMVKVNK